ncbi:Chromate reductase [Arsenophonus endosymbiont of Aleurodicus floccissimus]|uniref:NADPH-dependent FMN reductase n=1 Tax=Arsenophonus endosymbiont of Aleurodicus floccissimus TaxID=2152761 RepID=UPI000E6B2F89|nr:NADPH-dependent FMN reductase [Arsenophonus endosymbiont of Aleurodicus floccissimus]SPP31554.1 Chromate reductase [Arsenophonus endosymbiont of Aleurodicus floccissimus]
MKEYKVVIIVGSLRKGSYNKKLANVLIKLAHPQLQFSFAKIGKLPLYNKDDDEQPSKVVQDFKQQIADADGVIFVTAEYNRSIPGVLKNALDQGSRPYGKNVWAQKPTGVIGISPSSMGSALSQQHLRNVLTFLDMPTLNQPEAFIQWNENIIDQHGNLLERTKIFLQKWLDAYSNFLTKQLN